MTTDVNGVYAFTGLPQGSYTVEASAEGFEGQYKPVTLPATGPMNFTLEPGLKTPLLEDIDGNNAVDAVDIQRVINAALGNGNPDPSDVNRDGAVNAVDIQLVVNEALGIQ